MKYLSIIEAAKRLHCSSKTVIELVSSGHLWAKKEADSTLLIESDSISDLIVSDKFSVIQSLSTSSVNEDTPVPRPLIKVGFLVSEKDAFGFSPIKTIHE